MLRLHTWSPPIPCGMFLPHTSVWRYMVRHHIFNSSFIFENPRSENFFTLGIQKRRPEGRHYWTIRYNVSYFKL